MTFLQICIALGLVFVKPSFKITANVHQEHILRNGALDSMQFQKSLIDLAARINSYLFDKNNNF